jgi:SAM-dependent methyltransferase
MNQNKDRSNSDSMKNINQYWQQLTPEEISKNYHREFVGGFWDELGTLQFKFLQSQGLLPHHKFVDIGCGALRGGIYFIRYLDKGNYYGLDINASLIEAGKIELQKQNLLEKNPTFLISDRFTVSDFDMKFDYGLAQSVFTHLFSNHIQRCLVEISRVFSPDGKFFATYFEAPRPAYTDIIHQIPGNTITNFDSDPFHYSFEEMKTLGDYAGLSVSRIGEWGHPRNQKMLCFTLK